MSVDSGVDAGVAVKAESRRVPPRVDDVCACGWRGMS